MNNVWTVAFKTPCTGLPFCSRRAWRSLIPIDAIVPTSNTRQISTRTNLKARWNSPRTEKELVIFGLQARRRCARLPWPSVLLGRNTRSRAMAETRQQVGLCLRLSQSRGRAFSTTGGVNSLQQPPEEENPTNQPKSGSAQTLLSESEVKSIVGPELSFDQGLQLLQDLQFRRTTGSLAEEGINFPSRPEITREQAIAALDWLRANHPMDEEAAAMEWAEEEAAKLEAQYTEKAEKLWLYKRDEELDCPVEIQSQDDAGLYGQSVLEQRRKAREAQEKAEEEQRAEEAKAGNRPPEPYKGHDLIVAKKAELSDSQQRKYENWERLKAAAELPTEQILANRSAISRLWAPWLLGLSTVAALIVFAESYDPPSRSERFFPNYPPSWVTCGTIAIINLAIFMIWKRPEAWRFMNRYFLLSAGHPKAFSVIGTVFSHQTLYHLSVNMAFFLAIGIPLHQELTRGPFVSVYLSSGILGALTTLTFAVLTKDMLLATVGASGAVYGLLGAHLTLQAWRKMGFQDYSMEYPTVVPLVGFMAWEVWSFWKARNLSKIKGGVDHLGHLGGMIGGAGAGYWIRCRAEGNIKAVDRGRIGVDTLSVGDEMLGHSKDNVERVK